MMSSGIFVDASALCAIILDEPEREAFKLRISGSHQRLSSPMAIFETTLAVASRKQTPLIEAERLVQGLLEAGGLDVVDVTPEVGRIAVEAHARYGKGTGHRARLNMGDCFAYACAKAHGVALLYKGDDFVHTDLA